MQSPFNFWDNMAKRYPRYNDPSMRKDVDAVLNWCESKGVDFKNRSILDIGAGTGSMALILALKGASILAMDISQAMLDVLNEDASALGLSSQISTIQSDWEALKLDKKYDIVLASMTPAISSTEKVEKMIESSLGLGIYVGWGKFRKNAFVDALTNAHEAKDDCTKMGCFKAAQFIEFLQNKNISHESYFFETQWEDEYSYEDAKEYAYDQLQRKEIVPNEAIVEKIMRENMVNGKIVVQTKAEKGVILWRV